MSARESTPNALINSSSPYLLQHAYNPVDWKPWSAGLIEENRTTGKLLLISIGYSACHWCHVMEHECFEDPEVARLMNQHFVCIKVDREERPDIDQIYMDALQLMTGQGGWPLNIVALPDQRPFWGATYLPRDRWMAALGQLAELYEKDPAKVESYAGNLHQGLLQNRLLEEQGETAEMDIRAITGAVNQWSERWDEEYGGNNRAPKFMMPVTLDFLMHYGWERNDRAVLEHVRNTLTRMAWGGVHDVVGGGFARYSVDGRWHVPHFEKMLYDNALLLGTYADAWTLFGDPLFRDVARGIVTFLDRELTHPEGGLYSALDADSRDEHGKSEEGAYYVWTAKELESLLAHRELEIFRTYFNLDGKALWEEGKNVLYRDRGEELVAGELGLETSELRSVIDRCLLLLRNHREEYRSRPGLDHKVISSWNAMAACGLAKAYRAFGDGYFLEKALSVRAYLERFHLDDTASLLTRTGLISETNGLEGFLDDYAYLIRMYLELYQSTGERVLLEQAVDWTEYVLEHFSQPDSPLLAYTSDRSEALIRRTVETEDNVIPSSNSVMNLNLWTLGQLFPSGDYSSRAAAMRSGLAQTALEHPNYYANWLISFMLERGKTYEIAGLGPDFLDGFKELWKTYDPGRVFSGATVPSDYPEILSGKCEEGKTLYYACQRGTCKLPTNNIDQLRIQLSR